MIIKAEHIVHLLDADPHGGPISLELGRPREDTATEPTPCSPPRPLREDAAEVHQRVDARLIAERLGFLQSVRCRETR